MIVAIHKPRGETSFFTIKKVRSVSGIKKVGHSGTLDPFAEGVLVVGIGRNSTRKLASIACQEKEYRADLKLGIKTDTLDPEGKVIERSPVPELEEKGIKKVLCGFIGEIEQIPPMFSAKQVRGIRLYQLARQNIEIERNPVKVQIKSLTLESYSPDSISFSVICSKGTYIRQLGADIAEGLGTVGYLTSLQRIRVGDYTLDDCLSIEELSETWLSIAA